MSSLAARRVLLAGLLAAATLLFAVGVIAERSVADVAAAVAVLHLLAGAVAGRGASVARAASA